MTLRPAPPTPAWTRTRVITASSGLCLTVVTVVLYTVDPSSVGRILYGGLGATFVLVTGIAPLALGARPLRVWIPEMFGCILLLPALAGMWLPHRIGWIPLTDLALFLSYGFLLLWLQLVLQHIGPARVRTTLLDALAATLGTFLAVWAGLLMTLAARSVDPHYWLVGLYPVVDVAVLATIVHLCRRLGRPVTALRLLELAVGLQLVLDVAYATWHILWASRSHPTVLSACYLIVYFLIALAASDHSVRDLTRRPPETTDDPVPKQSPLITVAVTPAILATAVPVQGTVDLVMRTSLVGALMTLLFLRLSKSIQAVSDAEAASHHQADHDALTGLYNRSALLDLLERRLREDARRGRCTGVLFLDCDNFKYVNDTWGHHAGDNLLVDVARRLPAHLGATDLLARHGGDEFVMVTSGRDAEEVERLADRVLGFFTGPIEILPGREHVISPSIGLAVRLPDEQISTDALLGRADIAMYEAKQRGRGAWVRFDTDLAERARLWASAGDRLAEAVREDRFTVELEPVMGGTDYTTLMGWEALARWTDPELGSVRPRVFIPLAERFGLIREVGRLVVGHACREYVRRVELGTAPSSWLRLNISPDQLLDPDFVDQMVRIVQEYGLSPSSVHLEIPEPAFLGPTPSFAGALTDLRAAGFRIAVDDFGTGYASIETLVRLPVDCVKLDRSLVALLADPDRAEAVRQVVAVIALVRSLGIEEIIAEGVETQAQHDALRRAGCPFVQGRLYTMASPA